MLAPKKKDLIEELLMQNATHNGKPSVLLEQQTCIEQEKKELKRDENKKGILSIFLVVGNGNNNKLGFIQESPKMTATGSTESPETYFLKKHTIEELNEIGHHCQVYYLDEYHKTEFSFKVGANSEELHDILNIRIDWEEAKIARAKNNLEHTDNENQVSKGKTKRYGLRNDKVFSENAFFFDNLDFTITVCLKKLNKTNPRYGFGPAEFLPGEFSVPKELLKKFPSKEEELA